MIFVKAIATAILLALIGLLIGPIVALVLMSHPEGACGMYWLIPATTGAIGGAAVGGLLGFSFGLVA